MSTSRSSCLLSVEGVCVCWAAEDCPKTKAPETQPKFAPLEPEFWCLAVECDCMLVSEVAAPRKRQSPRKRLKPTAALW